MSDQAIDGELQIWSWRDEGSFAVMPWFGLNACTRSPTPEGGLTAWRSLSRCLLWRRVGRRLGQSGSRLPCCLQKLRSYFEDEPDRFRITAVDFRNIRALQ